MSFVEAKNITKNYRIDFENQVEAIKKINDITISEGEFVCIMGPSGSGKSTLLNILTTIDLPTKGKILVNQKNVRVLSENALCTLRYEYLGFIFQELNILGDFTIYDNIAIPLVMASVKKDEIKKRVEKITTDLGINRLLIKYPHECSGGQLQRVAIARALITNPKLIVADEPTGNLDANTTDEILKLFEKFYQNGDTIIMVTHDPYVASFASRVLYLEDGLLDDEICRSELSQKAFFDKIIEMNELHAF